MGPTAAPTSLWSAATCRRCPFRFAGSPDSRLSLRSGNSKAASSRRTPRPCALGLAGLCLWFAATGCSASSRNEHDALLSEYQKIADRATELVQAKSPPDASTVAEMTKLAEKAVALTHKKLTLSKSPTLQQAERYDAVSARFQKALHAVCPKCPGSRS